ncbi:hypothetical protein ACWC1D_31970 [Streptomyces sp. NPDC001478]
MGPRSRPLAANAPPRLGDARQDDALAPSQLNAYSGMRYVTSLTKLTVPATNKPPSGNTLRYRVRAYDGVDYGPWSGYTTFRLNAALPEAPAIVCDSYEENSWTAKAAGAVSCTLGTTSSDGAGYLRGLDRATDGAAAVLFFGGLMSFFLASLLAMA